MDAQRIACLVGKPRVNLQVVLEQLHQRFHV